MKISSVVITVLGGAATAFTVLTSPALADGPPPLPPEAYAACESKADGEECTVQLRDRELHGTCAPDHEGKRLFCRPNDLPPRPPGGP